MMRFCPHCQTERPLTEIFCEGHISTQPCGWDLSAEPIHESGWRPQLPDSTPTAGPADANHQEHTDVCVNGHPMEESDLICLLCGEDSARFSAENPVERDTILSSEKPAPTEPASIGDWLPGERINRSDSPRERYNVTHRKTGRQGVLTLYQLGEEPDQSVYDVFRLLPRSHVPELLDTGRQHGRPWHVTEHISGGSLEAFIVRGDYWQPEEIPQLIREIGQALTSFAEHGLRHRDLRPSHLMIRQRSPLDIVIIEFGSACLSEFDLDIVSPLDISCYSAPETLAGGVSAASDWWSLGIILLEQLTRGRCFEQVHTNAFLIQVMTHGVIIPDDLDENIRILLRGLLTRDRTQRWQGPEVSAWLDGRPMAAPVEASQQQLQHGRQIILAGQTYSQPAQFALKAAETTQWDEALSLLLCGELLSWLAGMSHYESIHQQLCLFTDTQKIDDNLRLMLTLKVLNPDMPFIYRGEIITPSWLLGHTDISYSLINDPLAQLLRQIAPEHWLVQLYYRQQQICSQAEALEITLNENILRIYLLITSHSQLIARWQVHYQLFPDTHHSGLRTLIDRQNLQDEELILLLSADIGQFIARQTLLDQAVKLAKRYRISTFERTQAEALLQLPRLTLYQQLRERIGDFCRCGIADIDEWTEQFLLTRRLPLEQIIVMLAIAAEHWVVPEKQRYVQQVMQFFTRKITANTQRGSLVRMRLTPSAGRVDLTELNGVQKSAQDLLQHLINRPKNAIAIDSQTLLQMPKVNDRLRVLQSKTELYQRDTGINGMYLGFPFLLIHTRPSQMKPRIAPLFLWPVNLVMNAGLRGVARLQFDNERGAVRLNPALVSLDGISPVNEWQAILEQLLGHAGLTVDSVMEKLSVVMPVTVRNLSALPSDPEIGENSASLCCSAVLFHSSFIGQAIGKDLQQIAGLPIENTALEKALGLAEPEASEPCPLKAEEHYFVSATDPSQETVVAAARQNRGLLIEGPPGTGKSQTIVNLIADTIGQQKTALVICQKPAALEVVYKRLIACGLMNRIVLVHQAQKGRNIIQSVRSQIDDLFMRGKTHNQTTNWVRERDIVARRMDKYESQLDDYYNGLYQYHEAAGVSYRQLMASLIAWRDEADTGLDLPQLQSLFRSPDAIETGRIIDDIVQVAPLWLAADYEDSPLSQLHSFSADDDSCQQFNRNFAGFMQNEAAREQTLTLPYTEITIETLTHHQAALAACKAAFTPLSSLTWQQFARWLPLFYNEKGRQLRGPQIISQLEALITRLQQVDTSLCDPRLFHLLADCENPMLAQLSQALKEKQHISFWFYLNPFYYARQRKLNVFSAMHGISGNSTQYSAFSHSIRAEQTWRLIRNELNQLHHQLELDAFSESEAFLLRQALEKTTDNLRRIADLTQLVVDYPQPAHLFSAIRDGQYASFSQRCLEIEAAIMRALAQEKSRAALRTLTPYLTTQTQQRFTEAIKHQTSLNLDLAAIEAALPTLKPYLQFSAFSEDFSETHREILALLRPYADELSRLSDTALSQTIKKTLRHYYYLALKALFEHHTPALSAEQDALDDHVQQLENTLAELQTLNREAFNKGLEYQQISPRRMWEEITRLTGKRARRLREFIEEGEAFGLMHLRPVWLMTPDVASQVLPLKAGFFDTVIYDEASQMPIEYALPTLYRGKRMIVSGDEKQMPPSSFFAGLSNNESDDEENGSPEQQQEKPQSEWDYRQIGECPDLLHLARTVLSVYTLDIHYRSAYRDLIDFSNHAFYEKHLNIPAQHSKKVLSKIKPLSLEMINGTYSNQTNPDEAEAIITRLAEIWQAPFENRPSVGIVTFNQKQVQLIQHLLIERTETDTDFCQAYDQEIQRQEQGEDMSLFVKNVENVQGDERDVILFSTTFGRNKQGTFRRNFGVLGQTGGERRLNVAITRARKQVIIFSSMPLDEISDLLSTYRKPEIPRDFLQGYLTFARNLTTGQNEHNQALLNRMCRTDTGLSDNNRTNDGFVQSVVNFVQQFVQQPFIQQSFVQQQGWQIAKVQQAGVFYFDCIIEDKHSGRYIIGLECDMPYHPLLQQARAREIWRASVLKHVVPTRYRISVAEWFHQPDIAQQKLVAAITQAFLTHNL
ncbi:AAA domain-containing protein [Xenorhabdus anantnagensis]|uniref:AAA domain-containing protein n=1 Tax=Xenorhabdus anantnagensis TaxID=3025875 RepID=A0ABT5LWX1_9GAMM|nr:AAA domain-containing protein [Xenorhabdus anantnagensis]MDC9598233.1 AAA domain-containing protein [Xenorhabdus anantnagensis]